MRIIGLTGGIATGKSTVSAVFAEQGLPVLDADKIARQVVQKGRWGYRRVVKVFGREILQADGEIDRKKLGEIVFQHPELRKQLNAATHPLVIAELAMQLLLHWLVFHFVVVVDVPLLFEGGLDRFTSMNITVACDADTQLQRLMARDSSQRAAAEARIAAQMPLAEKMRRSNLVIDNSGSLEELQEKAKAISGVLKDNNSFRGLLSSPLAIAMAICALVPNARRYAELSWHRFSQKYTHFGQSP